MKRKNILTINIITYNHAPYIAKCIDSILEQKTSFGYIIRIFDDCSTDGTTKICQQYADKFPDKIEFYPTEKNLGPIYNPIRAYSGIKTPYYILVEGDDYLCGKGRFQEQYEILERHPECSFCAGCSYTNFVNGEVQGGYFPILKSGIYSLDWLRCNIGVNIMPHSGTRMVRTKCISLDMKQPNPWLNDITQMFELLRQGAMYYVDKEWCVYNYTGTGIWSGQKTFGKIKFILNNLYEYNVYTNGFFEEILLEVFRRDLEYNINFYNKMKVCEEIDNENIQFIPFRQNATVYFNLLYYFKRFRRFIFPPAIMMCLHIPRNLYRYCKRRWKK